MKNIGIIFFSWKLFKLLIIWTKASPAIKGPSINKIVLSEEEIAEKQKILKEKIEEEKIEEEKTVVKQTEIATLEILGKKFSLESIKELLYILEQIKKDKNLSECKITGNFDTYFQTKDFLKKNSISEIKKILSLFQLITKTIEKSHINFVCEVN